MKKTLCKKGFYQEIKGSMIMVLNSIPTVLYTKLDGVSKFFDRINTVSAGFFSRFLDAWR